MTIEPEWIFVGIVSIMIVFQFIGHRLITVYNDEFAYMECMKHGFKDFIPVGADFAKFTKEIKNYDGINPDGLLYKCFNKGVPNGDSGLYYACNSTTWYGRCERA